MAAFSSLYSLIRFHVKNAPDVTIDEAIRHATREFCRRSYWLRETIEVDTIAGEAYYDIEPADPVNQEIIGVIAVEDESYTPLRPATQQLVRYTTGHPRYFIFLPPSTLELIPYPSATETNLETYVVRVALQPTLVSVVVPDDIIREHDQTVAYGAINYLASMPSEGWSNDKVADMAFKMFRNGCADAKSDASFGKTPWDSTMQFGRFDI